MKYCEDCKWFRANWSAQMTDVCTNENAKLIDAGSPVHKPWYPHAKRERSTGNCGPEGKLWEPENGRTNLTAGDHDR